MAGDSYHPLAVRDWNAGQQDGETRSDKQNGIRHTLRRPIITTGLRRTSFHHDPGLACVHKPLSHSDGPRDTVKRVGTRRERSPVLWGGGGVGKVEVVSDVDLHACLGGKG